MLGRDRLLITGQLLVCQRGCEQPIGEDRGCHGVPVGLAQRSHAVMVLTMIHMRAVRCRVDLVARRQRISRSISPIHARGRSCVEMAAGMQHSCDQAIFGVCNVRRRCSVLSSSTPGLRAPVRVDEAQSVERRVNCATISPLNARTGVRDLPTRGPGRRCGIRARGQGFLRFALLSAHDQPLMIVIESARAPAPREPRGRRRICPQLLRR